MKRLLLLLIAVIGLSSCGPKQYLSYSAGKDNVSYIMVLTDGPKYEFVNIVVDGKSYVADKLFKVKHARKATPIVTEPGKHNVKIYVNGELLYSEDYYIALQETKKIVLR